MSCNSPLLARRCPDGSLQILNRDKWSIFEAESYFGKRNIFFIPCGKCSGCRLAKRKEYAIRCAMEAKSYGDNVSFITLTYDDEHNKGYLVKRDLQGFLRKLRRLGYKIRYFACGEYGGLTLRPHYHVVIFGYFPKDAKLFNESSTGFPVFRSSEVESVWKYGFVTIQHFTAECAGYVAGYVQKKIGDDKSFLLMSKKPGLGYQYMVDHAHTLVNDDFVCDDFGNIKKAKSPRYFDRVAEKLGIDMTYTKEKRLEAMEISQAGEMMQYGVEREVLLKRKAEVNDKKERKLVRQL